MDMHNPPAESIADIAARHYDRLEGAVERRQRVVQRLAKKTEAYWIPVLGELGPLHKKVEFSPPFSYRSHVLVMHEVGACAARAARVEFTHTLAAIRAEPELAAAA